MHDLRAVLHNIKRLLRPNGRAVLLDVALGFRIPPIVDYYMVPYFNFVGNVRRYGWDTARRLLRFFTSEAWVQHAMSDEYLSQREFETIYGEVFPGCIFRKKLLGPMVMIWENKENT
jgi:SAM-dependent methyltransferase